MAKLTRAESQWIAKVEDLLKSCPKRFGFFTIGDKELIVYDRTLEGTINELSESLPFFCTAVDECDAHLGQINFPVLVHSTAG
jgi:hypothetical protein